MEVDLDTSTTTSGDVSISSGSERNDSTTTYDNNMKMFLSCIERISYTDEFDQQGNSKIDNEVDTDDEDKFSDCDLSSIPHNGRNLRRRAATFSFYPEEKKKEPRLLSPIKKEMVEFDETSAARFLMELKTLSNSYNDTNDDYKVSTSVENSVKVKGNISSFVYRPRPRSNSLPDFGSNATSSLLGDDKSGYVGIYSPEARKKRLERFFEKKKHR